MIITSYLNYDYVIIYSTMYMTAGEHMKAIEIMGENGWVDKLVIVHVVVCNVLHKVAKHL